MSKELPQADQLAEEFIQDIRYGYGEARPEIQDELERIAPNPVHESTGDNSQLRSQVADTISRAVGKIVEQPSRPTTKD